MHTTPSQFKMHNCRMTGCAKVVGMIVSEVFLLPRLTDVIIRCCLTLYLIKECFSKYKTKSKLIF